MIFFYIWLYLKCLEVLIYSLKLLHLFTVSYDPLFLRAKFSCTPCKCIRVQVSLFQSRLCVCMPIINVYQVVPTLIHFNSFLYIPVACTVKYLRLCQDPSPIFFYYIYLSFSSHATRKILWAGPRGNAFGIVRKTGPANEPLT